MNKIVGHPAGMADDWLVYGKKKKKTPHTFGDVSEKCSVWVVKKKGRL